jgi:hypothetical protein
VRHVRMLGLCLVALFAMGAVAAGPALAKKAHQPGTLEGEWKVYKGCPINNPEFVNASEEFHGTKRDGESPYCFVGKTSGGKEGGNFTVGGVVTPLSKPVTLQGGVVFYEGPAGLEGRIFPAEGTETLQSPELNVPKGINLITSAIQAEANWPRSLEENFDYAKVHHETKLDAKIVVAGGNLLYEEQDGLSTEHLLTQEGSAFTLPLRVILSGPWLDSLGGGQCTIGTEEHPVFQHLTSGESIAPPPYEANTQHGEVGELSFNESFSNITIKNSKLVDSTWPVEVEAQGCGGAYESYVDAAVSKVLGLPAPVGASTTVLKGTLGTGNANVVKSESETGTEG